MPGERKLGPRFQKRTVRWVQEGMEHWLMHREDLEEVVGIV